MTAAARKPFYASKWWWLYIAVSAVIGYFVGGQFADRYPDGLQWLEPNHVVAAMVAGLYLMMGVVVLIGTASPRFGVAMRMSDDDEEWQETRTLSRNSAFGCLFIGLTVVALLAADPAQIVTKSVGGVLAGLSFAASAWFTWRIWQQMDELWRRVTSDATVIGFYLVFVPGVIWAGASQLGLIEPLAPLGWISLLLLAPLISSVIANARRGMLRV